MLTMDFCQHCLAHLWGSVEIENRALCERNRQLARQRLEAVPLLLLIDSFQNIDCHSFLTYYSTKAVPCGLCRHFGARVWRICPFDKETKCRKIAQKARKSPVCSCKKRENGVLFWF